MANDNEKMLMKLIYSGRYISYRYADVEGLGRLKNVGVSGDCSLVLDIRTCAWRGSKV